MPPREVLEAGRSLLLSTGEGCGFLREGGGVRDRVDSALGLGGLLPASDGLTPAVLAAGLLSPCRLRLRPLDGEGGSAMGNGAIAASSALGCGVRGRGVGSTCIATPGLCPGGGGGLGGGLGASCPG